MRWAVLVVGSALNARQSEGAGAHHVRVASSGLVRDEAAELGQAAGPPDTPRGTPLRPPPPARKPWSAAVDVALEVVGRSFPEAGGYTLDRRLVLAKARQKLKTQDLAPGAAKPFVVPLLDAPPAGLLVAGGALGDPVQALFSGVLDNLDDHGVLPCTVFGGTAHLEENAIVLQANGKDCPPTVGPLLVLAMYEALLVSFPSYWQHVGQPLLVPCRAADPTGPPRLWRDRAKNVLWRPEGAWRAVDVYVPPEVLVAAQVLGDLGYLAEAALDAAPRPAEEAPLPDCGDAGCAVATWQAWLLGKGRWLLGQLPVLPGLAPAPLDASNFESDASNFEW